MKKRYIITDLFVICLFGFTLFLKFIYKYDFPIEDRSFKSLKAHYTDVFTAEKLLKDVLENDQPSQFWKENFIKVKGYSNVEAFYSWKITLLLEEFTSDKLETISYKRSSSKSEERPVQISLKASDKWENLKVVKYYKDGQYSWHLAFELYPFYLSDSRDIDYDGKITLKDYHTLLVIRKTGNTPDYIKKNKIAFEKRMHESYIRHGKYLDSLFEDEIE